jgi:hypothetical protein
MNLNDLQNSQFKELLEYRLNCHSCLLDMIDTINVLKHNSTEADFKGLLSNCDAKYNTKAGKQNVETYILDKNDIKITAKRLGGLSQFGHSDNIFIFIDVPGAARLFGDNNNLRTCSPGSLRDFATRLEKRMRPYFSDFDFAKSRLTRLDLSLTLPVPQPYRTYERLLRQLKFRLPLNATYTNGNLEFGNNRSHFLTIYDKQLDLNYDQQDMRNLSDELGVQTQGLIRFEETLKSNHLIKQQLAVSTGAGLLNAIQTLAEEFVSRIRSAIENVTMPPVNENLSDRLKHHILEAHPFDHRARTKLLTIIFAEVDLFHNGLLEGRLARLHGAERRRGKRFLNAVKSSRQPQFNELAENDKRLQEELLNALRGPLVV